MDVFTGQQIEINGERYLVEAEPEMFRDEFRVVCKPERGIVSIIFSCPDLDVLRAAIGHFVVTPKRKRSRGDPPPELPSKPR
jgi:hypothetical protein